MFADIYLNDKHLGNVTTQFARTHYDVSSLLSRGGSQNRLVVAFEWGRNVSGRFMACSGGWDWAPYTPSELQNSGAQTFTRGIWKSVYLAQTTSAAIMHVVPHVFYRGAFPAAPLTDKSHGDFEVAVKVYFEAPRALAGRLTVTGAWGASNSSGRLTLPAGQSATTLLLPARAADVKLWWPTGMGAQTLYNISVAFQADDAAANANVQATRRVGFRTFALVTGNDTDPAYVQKNKDADGSDTMGMYFRVNGAIILSRGANMIPMDEMEGRFSAAAHRQLVQSAVDGRMNTLRVWGGGVFLPDAWYDACDELGVLVYHDMQYAGHSHTPTNNSIQTNELQHQIRRLSHHASIVIWDGCNECHVVIGTPTGIYATFVMTLVASEDQSRVVWPSCPASGWTNGVNRLTSLPNGSPLGLLPRMDPPSIWRDAVAGGGGRGEAPAAEPSNCTFQYNVDYDPGSGWAPPNVTDMVGAGARVQQPRGGEREWCTGVIFLVVHGRFSLFTC